MAGSHAHSHGHGGHDHAGHGHAPERPALREIVCDDCPCDGALALGEPHTAGIAAAPSADRRRLLFSLGLTAFVMLSLIVGGVLSHSLALATDALHAMTDVGALVLSLLAMAVAMRPVNARKTYGYHRLEILSALGNGVSLLALSIWVVVEAVHRFTTPVEVHADLVMVFAGIGLCAMTASAWLLHGSERVNVRGAYLHVLGDALTSLAVLAGGALLRFFPAQHWIDPALSLVISLVIVAGAFRLVRETVDILIEATPAGIDSRAVSADIGAIGGIVGVHDLHIWTIGSGVPALSAHIVVKADCPTPHDALLLQIKTLLIDRYFIGHSTLQLESSAYSHLGH